MNYYGICLVIAKIKVNNRVVVLQEKIRVEGILSSDIEVGISTKIGQRIRFESRKSLYVFSDSTLNDECQILILILRLASESVCSA